MSYPCFLTFKGINFAIFKEKIPPRASDFLKTDYPNCVWTSNNLLPLLIHTLLDNFSVSAIERKFTC